MLASSAQRDVSVSSTLILIRGGDAESGAGVQPRVVELHSSLYVPRVCRQNRAVAVAVAAVAGRWLWGI